MNNTEKVKAYGYPSLGLITRFYRNCIGDEPLIHIETFLEENGDHPYKEKGSGIVNISSVPKYPKFI